VGPAADNHTGMDDKVHLQRTDRGESETGNVEAVDTMQSAGGLDRVAMVVVALLLEDLDCSTGLAGHEGRIGPTHSPCRPWTSRLTAHAQGPCEINSVVRVEWPGEQPLVTVGLVPDRCGIQQGASNRQVPVQLA